MQKIIALVIVLVGVGGGLALGIVFRPGLDGKIVGAESTANDAPDGEGLVENAPETDSTEHGGRIDPEIGQDGEVESGRDYIKIGRQIIIPVVDKGETQALMLFDLAIDVPISMTERAYAAEPRLRDSFLRVLFEMSYTGAFSSTYTDERVIEELRGKLRNAARRLLGDAVDDVLILGIMRQEI